MTTQAASATPKPVGTRARAAGSAIVGVMAAAVVKRSAWRQVSVPLRARAALGYAIEVQGEAF